MCKCVLCGHEDPKEIITHIRTEHKGGLDRYQLFFPFVPVVNAEVLRACRVFVETGARNSSVEGLTDDDVRTVVDTAERQKVERSQVIEMPDF